MRSSVRVCVHCNSAFSMSCCTFIGYQQWTSSCHGYVHCFRWWKSRDAHDILQHWLIITNTNSCNNEFPFKRQDCFLPQCSWNKFSFISCCCKIDWYHKVSLALTLIDPIKNSFFVLICFLCVCSCVPYHPRSKRHSSLISLSAARLIHLVRAFPFLSPAEGGK